MSNKVSFALIELKRVPRTVELRYRGLMFNSGAVFRTLHWRSPGVEAHEHVGSQGTFAWYKYRTVFHRWLEEIQNSYGMNHVTFTNLVHLWCPSRDVRNIFLHSMKTESSMNYIALRLGDVSLSVLKYIVTWPNGCPHGSQLIKPNLEWISLDLFKFLDACLQRLDNFASHLLMKWGCSRKCCAEYLGLRKKQYWGRRIIIR